MLSKLEKTYRKKILRKSSGEILLLSVFERYWTKTVGYVKMSYFILNPEFEQQKCLFWREILSKVANLHSACPEVQFVELFLKML